MRIRSLVRSLVYPPVRAITAELSSKRWAYNFDIVDDYGVLTNRAVNVDLDNTFEFYAPASVAAVQSIISQNITSTDASREFVLFVSTVGNLSINYGGTTTVILSPAQGYEPLKRYFVDLIGTTFTVSKDTKANVVRTGAFVRGAAREPTAVTAIGARGVGVGSYAAFFSGLQYDLKINGVSWSMSERNQVIQPSTPAGNNMTLINTTSDRWQEIAG